MSSLFLSFCISVAKVSILWKPANVFREKMHFLKKKVTYNCIEETYEAFSKRDTSFGEESLNSNHHFYCYDYRIIGI